MSSQDIVFNIASIFDYSPDTGALGQHEAKNYYIAAYQRGYKWASNDQNSPICVLMRDLFLACDNKMDEYYLQYITTKKRDRDGVAVLEVVDGQQRLTTITILLSILALKNNVTAISNGLLSYAVRKNVTDFFDAYIYNNINTIIGKTWNEFIAELPENNEQDIYYLFSAINKINQMIEEQYNDDIKQIEIFEKYVLNNVKMILNDIYGNVSCEEVFSNLNSNKIDLTETDLIKGLWLTKSARERENNERLISYREITEIRSVIGRQWDEISNWINRDEIKMFLFAGISSRESVNKLLLMLAVNEGYDSNDDKNALFYYFDTQIRGENKSASKYLSEYRELCNILTEWISDDELYNYLGYILFSKNRRFTLLNKEIRKLLRKDKIHVKRELKRLIFENTLNFAIDDLDYENDRNNIHNLLLAVNVFCYEGRFDFSAFNRENWSLEHIFPQNPANFNGEFGINDIELIHKLIDNDKWENIPQQILGKFEINIQDVCGELKRKIEEKKSCKITEYECKILNHIIKSDKLHEIGNMALLTKEDNSSSSNGMFDLKRINIARRVKNGSFVPRHTYDVFSKLLSEKMNADLKVWSEDDIDEHHRYLKEKFNFLKGANNE